MIWYIVAAAGLIVAGLAVLEFGFPAVAARAALALERRRNGLSLREKTIDGISLSYLEGGRGETLVLLHGFGADKDNFVRAAGELTRHFHLVVPDLPGFGDSTRLPDAPYTFTDQARRLHGLLHGLGLTRYHLGGSSMGGAIAAVYGALYPDEVISLWLLAPAGVDGATDSEVAARYRATGESLLVPASVADFKRVLALATEIEPFLTPSIKRVLGERGMRDLALHTRVFDEIATDTPINERMRESDVPTLIVWGDRDRVLDVSGGRILRDEMPNAELIEMKGIGHLPMVEAPRQSARDFVEFVSRLPARGAPDRATSRG